VKKVDNKKVLHAIIILKHAAVQKFEIYLFYHLHFYKKVSLFISPIFVGKLTRSTFLNSLHEQITTTVILKTYNFSCHNTSKLISLGCFLHTKLFSFHLYHFRTTFLLQRD